MSDQEETPGAQQGTTAPRTTEQELASLEKELTELYDKLKDRQVSNATFSMPGLFPGTTAPTGYAAVFKKLEEARQDLNLKHALHAERLIHEAYAHFNWCEDNVHWITAALEDVQPAPPAGSSSNWFVRLLPAPLRRSPRWVFLLLYMIAWIGGTAGVATTRPDWELASVPVVYLFWGTLGGATAGIFGVWVHTARADFDRNYVPWYLAKPLIGGIAGAVVYVLGNDISRVTATAATATPTSTPTPVATAATAVTTVTAIASPTPAPEGANFTAFGHALFLVAFVMGFFESLFISILEIARVRVRNVVNAALGQPEEKTQG